MYNSIQSIRYWTKTRTKREQTLSFQQVSLSAVWILRNGKYLCTVEPFELEQAVRKAIR